MIMLGMALLHGPAGPPPLMVIHVMVLVWSKDPQNPGEITASRVVVQMPGQKGEGDYFPLKRLSCSAERNRKRAKKGLSLLERWWATGGKERRAMLYLSTKEFQPQMNSSKVKSGKTHFGEVIAGWMGYCFGVQGPSSRSHYEPEEL